MQFIVIAPGHIPSLNPDDADLVSNAVVMEQLTATLVKERHGNTGSSEPYIVEKWQTSSDEKDWLFFFKKNLVAEDGTEIDAESFAKSLTIRLKNASSHFDIPAFNKLIGWQEFRSGKSNYIHGISVLSGNLLKMSFSKKPEGLLEYLAMPKFGFFSQKNFNNEENWQSNERIISSGPYFLKEFNLKTREITLKKRANWSLTKDTSPEEIHFKYLDWQSALNIADSTTFIGVRSFKSNWQRPDSLIEIHGAPIFMTSFVVSPSLEASFRRQFRKKIRAIQSESPLTTKDVLINPNFYPNSLDEGELVLYANSDASIFLKRECIVGYDSSNTSAEFEYLLSLAQKSLSTMCASVRLEPFDKSDPNWLKKVSSNTYYDIRIATVDIGGNPENWVMKMMFCSTLGVSFPDPSGRICKLTDEVEINPEYITTEAYQKEFNKILTEDSSVIPIYHSGYHWFIGKDFDTSMLNSTMVIPRIELFKNKK